MVLTSMVTGGATESPSAILVIEDDEAVSLAVRVHLEREGLRVHVTADGALGLKLALDGDYALVLVDLGVHTLNGLDVCRALRRERPSAAIIIMTSRDSEIDKVLGLEIGADDYVTKPFGLYELTARIRAQLRRIHTLRSAETCEVPPEGDVPAQRVGDLHVDFLRRRTTLAGRLIDLSVREFDLLAFLIRHPGRPFDRHALLESVWNLSTSGYADVVGAMILRLRRKIERDPSQPRYIITVRGIGYRFAEVHELD